MPTSLLPLPRKIAKELDRNFSHDVNIFYHDDLGWVSQQSNDDRSESDVEQTDQHEEIELPIERLGPFGTREAKIDLKLMEKSTNMYEIKIRRKLELLKEILQTEIFGQHAPITPVTLPSCAREVANIPEEATHFCWIYPPTGFTQLSKRKKAQINALLDSGDPEYTFLALGGFAYFHLEDETFHLLQLNGLVKADNGLIFDGPYRWPAEYTECLRQEGRFQEVTIAELSERGIKYYCFINPNEGLKLSRRNNGNWRPARNGGFVYLYDRKMRPHQYDCYFTVADQPSSDQISSQIRPFSLIRTRPKSSSTNNEQNNRFTCLICQDRTIRCLFLPCKHMCTCTKCAEKIRCQFQSSCPLCRNRFTEIWDVFL